LFCEDCGLQFWPRQSVCSRCGAVPTRQWLQLVSLFTLVVTFACNSLVDLYLLRRLVAGSSHPAVFHAWRWFNEKFSLYGWAALAVALLVWSIWFPRDSEMQKKEWLARCLLILLLLAGGMALLLPKIAGNRSAHLLGTLRNHPAVVLTLPWGIVALAAGILCMDSGTRDSLLGHGRVSTLVSGGLLLLLLSMILLAWSATFR